MLNDFVIFLFRIVQCTSDFFLTKSEEILIITTSCNTVDNNEYFHRYAAIIVI